MTIPPKRPMGAVPVAAHGHSISAGRRVQLPAEADAAVTMLGAALAPHGDGPTPEAAATVSDVCATHPEFLDGWARRGQVAYVAGDPVAAYAYARVGYHRGLDRLRRHGWGGTGEVHWSDPGNRGFLRSLHLLMLAAAAIGDTEEMARCRQFLLDLDPEDGLGVAASPPLEVGQMVSAAALP